MNRKQAERKAGKWLDRRAGLNVSFNKDGNLVKDYAPASLASLLLCIDKAAYKRGVEDGMKRDCCVTITPVNMKVLNAK